MVHQKLILHKIYNSESIYNPKAFFTVGSLSFMKNDWRSDIAAMNDYFKNQVILEASDEIIGKEISLKNTPIFCSMDKNTFEDFLPKQDKLLCVDELLLTIRYLIFAYSVGALDKRAKYFARHYLCAKRNDGARFFVQLSFEYGDPDTDSGWHVSGFEEFNIGENENISEGPFVFSLE